MVKSKIIAQGAEAIIIQKGNLIIKERLSKSYRHPELDQKIIKQRTKREAKLLELARKIINSPNSQIEDLNKIKMSFIEGKKLSENLEKLNYKDISKKIAKAIARLHDNEIIHGDLTTSNMILTEDNNLFFIDFGLGFMSNRIEDKAVDLHLIKQALEAKHYGIWEECFNILLKEYDSKYKIRVINQLKKVESRGRYKKDS